MGELVQDRDRRNRGNHETEAFEAHDVHQTEGQVVAVRD